jgi:modulator of FtsH protease HflK
MSGPLDELKAGSSTAGNQGPSQPESPLPPEPMAPEDAGSQALSEALRSSFAIVRVVMVLLVIVFFASGVFTVPSQEKAIILRFGRPVGNAEEQQLLGPGLHWSFPYPIDEVVRLPISRIQTVTSTTGWYATTPEAEATNTEPEPGMSLNPAFDGYALTGDGNIIHVRVTLRYRIKNPLNYTLNYVNASNVVQSALDNSILQAAGQFTVDQALLVSVTELKEAILERVRHLIDAQALGITVETADLKVIPPRQVRRAFEDFVAASLEQRKLEDDARAYANRVRNTAEGEAKMVVNAGKTEGDRLLQTVAADAEYFEQLLPQYQRDPNLFVTRLQTESLQRILTNAQDKILRLDNGARKMWLQLNREPIKPGGQQQQVPTPR